MMKDAGAPAEFPIVNSERGYPVGKAEGYAGGDPRLSFDYQAWHFLRQYLIDLLAGTKVTIWYEWSGPEGFSLYQPGEPTPAYTAARFFLQEFRGYRLEKRIPLASDQDFALLFTNPAGGRKLVAWTAPGLKESPDKTVTHSVDIPVDAQGPLTICQIYGEKGTTEAKMGQINLTLTGAPQYVTLKAP